MTCRQYIFAGHSHVRAFRMPVWSGGEPQLLPLYGRRDDKILGLLGASPRDAAYWDALVQNSEHKTVFLFWCGNQHLSRFLFATKPVFDFYLASDPLVPMLPNTMLVPETMVRAVLNEINKELVELLSRLISVPGCEPVLCGTPPPKGNDERLRTYIKEPNFHSLAQRLGFSVSDVPFTPLSVRRKLWVVVQELLHEIAESMGCKFQAVPKQALDSNGFLREEYWGQDASHANHDYGRLFLRQLVPADVAVGK